MTATIEKPVFRFAYDAKKNVVTKIKGWNGKPKCGNCNVLTGKRENEGKKCFVADCEGIFHTEFKTQKKDEMKVYDYSEGKAVFLDGEKIYIEDLESDF